MVITYWVTAHGTVYTWAWDLTEGYGQQWAS